MTQLKSTSLEHEDVMMLVENALASIWPFTGSFRIYPRDPEDKEIRSYIELMLHPNVLRSLQDVYPDDTIFKRVGLGLGIALWGRPIVFKSFPPAEDASEFVVVVCDLNDNGRYEVTLSQQAYYDGLHLAA